MLVPLGYDAGARKPHRSGGHTQRRSWAAADRGRRQQRGAGCETGPFRSSSGAPVAECIKEGRDLRFCAAAASARAFTPL